MSLDSSVGIGTGYGLQRRRSISGRGERFVSIPQRPESSRAQTASHSMDTGGYLPGYKAAGCETDHTPPSSAEVKKGGAIPPLTRISSWRGT
jgi:hypothetical protein